jgi:hypothetical protein
MQILYLSFEREEPRCVAPISVSPCCYFYCYMVQDLPEYRVGSQQGSWGISVIVRIRVNVILALHRGLLLPVPLPGMGPTGWLAAMAVLVHLYAADGLVDAHTDKSCQVSCI